MTGRRPNLIHCAGWDTSLKTKERTRSHSFSALTKIRWKRKHSKAMWNQTTGHRPTPLHRAGWDTSLKTKKRIRSPPSLNDNKLSVKFRPIIYYGAKLPGEFIPPAPKCPPTPEEALPPSFHSRESGNLFPRQREIPRSGMVACRRMRLSPQRFLPTQEWKWGAGMEKGAGMEGGSGNGSQRRE